MKGQGCSMCGVLPGGRESEYNLDGSLSPSAILLGSFTHTHSLVVKLSDCVCP